MTKRALPDIPTKELLRMRDACHRIGPGAVVAGVPRAGRGQSRAQSEVDAQYTTAPAMPGTSVMVQVTSAQRAGYTLEEILKELGTREHIPNKAEARAIRQKRARERK